MVLWVYNYNTLRRDFPLFEGIVTCPTLSKIDNFKSVEVDRLIVLYLESKNSS